MPGFSKSLLQNNILGYIGSGYGRLPYPPYGQHEGRNPPIDLLFLGHGADCCIGRTHLAGKLLIDAIFLPAKLLNVLCPFKVAHRNPTSIGEDIGYNQHAAFDQHFMGCR